MLLLDCEAVGFSFQLDDDDDDNNNDKDADDGWVAISTLGCAKRAFLVVVVVRCFRTRSGCPCRIFMARCLGVWQLPVGMDRLIQVMVVLLVVVVVVVVADVISDPVRWI